LATSALALVGASTADAQQLGLRGDVSESSVQQNRAVAVGNSNATRTTPPTGTAIQPYIPVSAGAVADTADGASSTTHTPNSQATGDPFASGPIPAPRSNASAPAGLDTTPTASTTD